MRWPRIDNRYRPFFFLLVIGFVTEVVSFILIKGFHRQNGFVVNIYILIEWIMIAWQFHVWGLLKQRANLFWTLVGLVSLVWVGEYFVFGHLSDFSPYFRCLYFFLIVLMSINNINFMITHDNRSLIRNPKFLICIGFLIYFVFMILDYWAYQVSRYNKSSLSTTFVFLMAYINAGTNSIYAIAFLLIPARVKFTLK
ncbi:MAG: hypothetical protein Q8927_09680 [Bacteroidota bacterium]|nr:hypothetical protein [Bacteroidota bacterium]MDP4216461.1 hypothetical protein [Bacteroidota bacterium]MDP4246046.1 hypothetical protein [Bacteroidota bacterium]MDP4252967.1 hypothetical protein [Bacteroidota bacterium]MDP4259055.1 hypothetical protein [Bacteroidota bacterium]